MFENLRPVCDRLGKRVCPLYVLDDANRAYLIGTAVPMSIDNWSFLATAAHVLKDAMRGRLVTFGAEETILVGGKSSSYDHVPGRTIDGDLAVLWLSADEAFDMGRRFVFTEVSHIEDVAVYDKLRLYAMLGYPHSKNTPKPNGYRMIKATPTYVVLREFADINKFSVKDKCPSIHFALASPRGRETDMLGKPFTLPKMQGVSGGGVWRIDIDSVSGRIHDPVLVGFGIEHHRQEGAFVVTRAKVIMPLLKDGPPT